VPAQTPPAASSSPPAVADRPTRDLRVASLRPLITPRQLADRYPLSATAHGTVVNARDAVQAILDGQDDRLLVVVGPCSIHDPDAALDYARRLATLKQELDDRLLIVMRVYFEKPRTTVGWKGLINDPHLDGTFDLDHGLNLARKLLLDINELGLPAGTEYLDPFTPQYLGDLIAWAAIGARTTESQTHRQMASGISAPVGFKNATTGDLQVALDAMRSAMSPHAFLGIDEDGHACIVQTAGNTAGHVILRGGTGLTNYDPQTVGDAARRLQDAGLPPVVMIDCSHANSEKKHEQQEMVWQSLIQQRAARSARPGEAIRPIIIGAMLESNLAAGNQPAPKAPEDKAKLTYGQSITDACIDWPTTERLLRDAHAKLG
jgi:3-deoxy-7-phosphoheptulonate synthase